MPLPHNPRIPKLSLVYMSKYVPLYSHSQKYATPAPCGSIFMGKMVFSEVKLCHRNLVKSWSCTKAVGRKGRENPATRPHTAVERAVFILQFFFSPH